MRPPKDTTIFVTLRVTSSKVSGPMAQQELAARVWMELEDSEEFIEVKMEDWQSNLVN